MANNNGTLRSLFTLCISVGVLLFVVYELFFSPSYPRTYKLGSVDKRFGISERRLLELIDSAKSLWEKEAQKELFIYDAESTFPVNLIFDERQQQTMDAKRAKAQIDKGETSYDMLEAEYRIAYQTQQQLQQDYNESIRNFETRMNQRNAKVSEWNQRGGATEKELRELQIEDQSIEYMREELDKKRFYVEQKNNDLNALVAQVNSLADRHNLNVKNYNGRFVHPYEFEQGSFDGNEINIYQFYDEPSLTMALAHEFGHALGFAHTKSPESIMYFKLEQQDLNLLRLSREDIDLIRNKFPR